MKDYMIRGTAANRQIRFFAITATDMVEEARKRHETSPVITAALGRLLCAGAMMGSMMKGEKELLTLQIRGNGPAGPLTVTADSKGHVKGYPANPVVSLPASREGKLDVGKAVGSGTLTVIKDMGMKDAYSGQVDLVSGEIAEDLTYYFAASEQTPSSVSLGVLMNRENTVAQAGGYIIQLMPDTDEGVIQILEERLSKVQPITSLLSEKHSPETILEEILHGLDPVFSQDRIPVSFSCNCSRERMKKALISLGKEEISKIICDEEPIEINCHFCNSHYVFTPEELVAIRKTMDKSDKN